ncbi:MAG: biotin/lipoyl-binding protein, partial [Cyanobacteria bacterium J06648_11]
MTQTFDPKTETPDDEQPNGTSPQVEDLDAISEWDDIELKARSRKGLLSGSRGLFLGIGVGMAIAVVGGRVMSNAPERAEAEPAPAPVEVAAAPALTVSLGTARLNAIPQTLKITGTVQAVDLLQVAPQAAGLLVQDVLVRTGDRVSRGQVLAILDDSVLQAQIAQAEAQLESARARVAQRQAELAQDEAQKAEADGQLKRYEALAAEGAISQEELSSRKTAAVTAREAIAVARANISSAEAEVRSQAANIARLKTQTRQTRVLSPSSGTIAEKLVRVGDVSSGSQPMFSLIRDDLLELQA